MTNDESNSVDRPIRPEDALENNPYAPPRTLDLPPNRPRRSFIPEWLQFAATFSFAISWDLWLYRPEHVSFWQYFAGLIVFGLCIFALAVFAGRCFRTLAKYTDPKRMLLPAMMSVCLPLFALVLIAAWLEHPFATGMPMSVWIAGCLMGAWVGLDISKYERSRRKTK